VELLDRIKILIRIAATDCHSSILKNDVEEAWPNLMALKSFGERAKSLSVEQFFDELIELSSVLIAPDF